MTTAQHTSNQATVSRLYDAVATGDAEVISRTIDEVVEPDVLFHAPVPTGTTGAQALKEAWPVLLQAFPDLHVAIEDVIEEGDKVVVRDTVTGTHLGEYRASHQPANPSPTTRSSSAASPAAGSRRSGASSTSSHSYDNSASFRPSDAPSVRRPRRAMG